MKIYKLNTFLSTFHFVLLFVGYQIATTIFLPVTSDIEGISRTVTVPYRGFTLLLAFIVIFLNIKKKVNYPIAMKVLIFYWLILIIRIFYDTHLRTDVNITDGEKSRLWMFIFAITLLPTYAVIKSFKSIDLNKALKWIFGLTILTLSLSFFSNKLFQEAINQRISSNVGLNSIDTGHFAVTGIILSIYFILNGKKSILNYSLMYASIILCTIALLRAGSRGPILALAIVLTLWMLSYYKSGIRSFIVISMTGVLLFLFMDRILSLIGNISPIMFERLQKTDQLESRFFVFQSAINAFIENPILGKQFAIFLGNGEFIYAHNIILDSLMGMGIIGGATILFLILIAFKYSYKLIQLKNVNFWIGLVLIQNLIKSMVSGSFYYNSLLTILLTFIIIQYYYQKKQINFNEI